MSVVRVLCWDDPRCLAPMRAAATAFAAVRPGVAVEVVSRPLASFNDQPIEEAAAGHDVLVFDYPMAPRAARTGTLLPLERGLVPDTVGVAGASFDWAGRTWGLAADLACQVAVSRPDLLPADEVPATWPEVLAFARAHPGRTAVPLFHSDVFCTLLSISVALEVPVGPAAFVVDDDAVAVLCELAGLLGRDLPELLERNPPSVLDELARSDRWAYGPLCFGYARYSARPGGGSGRTATGSGRTALAWHDAPRDTDGGRIGSLLGGAGLGVSAHSAEPELAVAFAAWYASAAVQRDLVGPAGGQPAAAAAWADPALDRDAGGFYSATAASARAAVRRPAHPGWPAFQHRAGLLLHDGLGRGEPPGRLAAALRGLLDRHSLSFDPEQVVSA